MLACCTLRMGDVLVVNGGTQFAIVIAPEHLSGVSPRPVLPYASLQTMEKIQEEEIYDNYPSSVTLQGQK